MFLRPNQTRERAKERTEREAKKDFNNLIFYCLKWYGMMMPIMIFHTFFPFAFAPATVLLAAQAARLVITQKPSSKEETNETIIM